MRPDLPILPAEGPELDTAELGEGSVPGRCGCFCVDRPSLPPAKRYGDLVLALQHPHSDSRRRPASERS
jgi:hypothetical protein